MDGFGQIHLYFYFFNELFSLQEGGHDGTIVINPEGNCYAGLGGGVIFIVGL